ncbi:MAG: lipoprotein [Streptococcus sobrinus]
MKRAFKVLLAVLSVVAIFTLAACGNKSKSAGSGYDKNGIPTELKKSYTGSSKVTSYFGFPRNGSTLVFDMKAKKLTIKTDDENQKFNLKVIPEKKLNTKNRGAFKSWKPKVEGKKYFFIETTFQNQEISPRSSQSYLLLVILDNSGKNIRVVEFNQNESSDSWYDFSGEAD